MSIDRPRLAQIAADTILKDIVRGKFKKFLPGIKALGRDYKVSSATVTSALHILQELGYLTKAEIGKRRKIIEVTGRRDIGRTTLLIIAKQKSSLPLKQVRLIEETKKIWLEVFEEGSISEIYSSKVTQRDELDSLLLEYAVRAIVIFDGTEQWSAELKGIDLPVFRLAGEPVDSSYGHSGWGYSFPEILTQLSNKLHQLGHHKVMAPVSRETLVPLAVSATKSSNLSTSDLIDEELSEQFPVFPQDNPAVWPEFWRRHLSRCQPTVVCCLTEPIFFSLYGFCCASGIKIPKQLSIVSLTVSEQQNYLLPAIAAPSNVNEQKQLELFRRWIKQDFIEQGYKRLAIDFDFAGSVADLK